MNQFAEGLYVRYRHITGTIKFISHEYITICIPSDEHKSKDVCVLVYRNEWKNVQLVKESEK
jgi:hypothetical protein